MSSSGKCCLLNPKAKVYRPYFWSTLKYKGQFALASGPCNACIDSIEGFLVSTVLHFQGQTEWTVLSSFLIYCNFVLGTQRILRCFFCLRYNRF